MSKAKEKFYSNVVNSSLRQNYKNLVDYAKELEEQNKEMLECLIEYLKYYNDIDYDEVGNFKEDFKKEISIVEKITDKSIEGVLKNE